MTNDNTATCKILYRDGSTVDGSVTAMRNPYQAPSASGEEINQLPAGRPFSIWSLLFLCAALSLLLVAGIAGTLWHLAGHDAITPINAAIMIAVRFAVLAALLSAIVGVLRRRQWGRWLGVLAIVALAATFALVPADQHYASAAERFGGFLGKMIIIPSLMAWWGYAFGFGSKAKRYFST